jgi:hypothetical protein
MMIAVPGLRKAQYERRACALNTHTQTFKEIPVALHTHTQTFKQIPVAHDKEDGKDTEQVLLKDQGPTLESTLKTNVQSPGNKYQDN